MRVLIIISMLLIGINAWSQNIEVLTKEEMAKVYESISNTYLNTSKYSFKMSYKSYRGHSSKLAVDVQTGYAQKDGNKSYSEVFGSTTIQNNGVRMVIDQSDNHILLYNTIDEKPNFDLDVYTSKLSSTEKITRNSYLGYTAYTLQMNEYDDIERVVVAVSSQNFITQITIYYRNARSWDDNGTIKTAKPKVVISYHDYKLGTVDNELFDITKFITKTNNQYNLTKAYHSWELSDMIVRN